MVFVLVECSVVIFLVIYDFYGEVGFILGGIRSFDFIGISVLKIRCVFVSWTFIFFIFGYFGYRAVREYEFFFVFFSFFE